MREEREHGEHMAEIYGQHECLKNGHLLYICFSTGMKLKFYCQYEGISLCCGAFKLVVMTEIHFWNNIVVTFKESCQEATLSFQLNTW